MRETDSDRVCQKFRERERERDPSHPTYTHKYTNIHTHRPASAEGQQENQNRNEISAPGTCKNCITVGISQGWPQELAASSEMLMTQCRSDDCPQSQDNVNLCGAAAASNPFLLPGCCKARYNEENYRPSALHPTSATGGGIVSQAPWLADSFGGTGGSQSEGLYGAVDATQYRRLKPDLVAPGINIVSARSDGDPMSQGTNGCRTCVGTIPHDQPPRDTAALVAMSGSKQAAAVVAAAALLVRQYFEAGFYPLGRIDSGIIHMPSAALVRAVLLTGTAAVDRVYDADGSARDISSTVRPNFDAGFGRLQLSKVLRIDASVQLKDAPGCKCLGENSGFFAMDHPDDDPETWRTGRFDTDYGSRCAQWDAMPGRIPACNTSFSRNQRSPNETCCKSWCFVSDSCSLGEIKPYLPGVHVAYEICKNQEEVLEDCPFRDKSVKRLVNLHVIDHIISDDTSPDAWGTYATAQEGPIGNSLAENETISYNLTILGASMQDPLVITMTFTDPPGELSRGDVLVNDLDLVITIIPILAPSPDLVRDEPDKFKRNRNMSVTYWGNEQTGGDRHNTAEQVRVNSFGPAEVIVTIKAKRVVVGHELRYPPSRQIKSKPTTKDANKTAVAANKTGTTGESSTRPACQTFALVITGDLLHLPGSNLPLTSSSLPLPPGICGRPDPPPDQATSRLTSTQILLIIIACSVVGALAMCIFLMALYYWRGKRKERENFERAPPNVQYKPPVTPVSALRYPDEIGKAFEVGTLGYVRASQFDPPRDVMEANERGGVAGEDGIKNRQVRALKSVYKKAEGLSAEQKLREMQKHGIGSNTFTQPFAAVLHNVQSAKFTGRLITSGDLFENSISQEGAQSIEEKRVDKNVQEELRRAVSNTGQPHHGFAPPLRATCSSTSYKPREAFDPQLARRINDQVQDMLETALGEGTQGVQVGRAGGGGGALSKAMNYREHPGDQNSLVLVPRVHPLVNLKGRAPSAPCVCLS